MTWVRVHRVIATLFLLTLPPAAYASFTGDRAHPGVLVYLPLLPLFALIVTGTWMLVRPWIARWRARRSPRAGAKST